MKFFKERALKKKHKRNSYAQDGEDMLLNSFFVDLKIYHGFYVDVGAHHPFRFSNTAFFYERNWNGINIEATPTLIEDFNLFRKKDINLNAGITNKKEFSEDRDKNTCYNIIEKVNIETSTLSEILEKYMPLNQQIDFMTIDVEGMDFQVIESNNWNKYRPLFLLVEQDFDLESIFTDKIYVFLSHVGYSLVGRTKRTSIYKLKNIE